MSSDGSSRSRLAGLFLLALLLWVNIYIVLRMFTTPFPAMNSMRGFWMSIARLASAQGGAVPGWIHQWFGSNWWPYIDDGIPFEFTYSPLTPTLTSLFSSWFHTSRLLALQWVGGIDYCLGPVALFFMAWRLTRAPVWSFLAGLLYSLYRLSEPLARAGTPSLEKLTDPFRLFILTFWDDTPHLLALALFPLALLFLARALERRSLEYSAAAAVTIAVMTFASTFGATVMALATPCLLLAMPSTGFWRRTIQAVLTGAFAYALCAHFLPPSLLHAAHEIASVHDGGTWTTRSLLALTALIAGFLILWLLTRRMKEWPLRFFLLFGWVTLVIAGFGLRFHSALLPQPERYASEADLALPLAAAFGVRALLASAPRWSRALVLTLAFVCCWNQMRDTRRMARQWIQPTDITRTIQYRAATWAARNIPGVRVYLPGTMNKWAGEFATLEHHTGSSWSQAYNLTQQEGIAMVDAGADTPEHHRDHAIAWMRAYGVGAFCVHGPKSPEYWPTPHPLQLDGVYPLLWREDDTSIYRLPQRVPGYAHIVGESGIVRTPPPYPDQTRDIEAYVAALDDPGLPAATFAWEGTNRIHISAVASPDQALSVQVSWHPGWHATVNGQPLAVMKDGLGLMWMQPRCNGACAVELNYDGGWELRICRWMGYAAWTGLLMWVIFRLRAAHATRAPGPQPAH